MSQTASGSEHRHHMSRWSLYLVTGIVLFLAGGVVLALGEGPAWTTAGTSLGIVAVALMGWVWWKRGDEK